MEEVNNKTELDNTDKKLHISDVSDIDFIFNLLEKMLNKQEKDIINYINNAMSKNERDVHSENIWLCLLRAKGVLAEIKMEMLANGRKIK